METHRHLGEVSQSNESWLRQHRWISYGALGVISYYLLTEHREHVLAYFPYLLLAACPLMHLFMHGGHHKPKEQGNPEQEKRS